MSGVRLHDTEMLHLLWLAPVFAVIFFYAAQRRAVALKHFAEPGLLARLEQTVSRTRRFWKAAAVCFAAALCAIALARPAWNPVPRDVQREGRDVVFVLDVSRSMLAEDLAPSRLGRAKTAILDCVDVLEGDRVGLVAFAGTAGVKCPLTLDYGFFRMMLEDLEPGGVARGGTLIGDALRRCLDDVFDDQGDRFRDIILITDGEDHDSFPVEAAREAGDRGIRLIAIGLGDENEGRRIPITDEQGRKTFLKHDGREVWTRLDANTLREMAAATPGGRYLNVATGAFYLGDIYEELVASAEKQHLEAETMTMYEEKYQLFLALAFTILCIEAAVPERRRQTI